MLRPPHRYKWETEAYQRGQRDGYSGRVKPFDVDTPYARGFRQGLLERASDYYAKIVQGKIKENV